MVRRKKDPKAFVTNKTLDEAVAAILAGMDGLFQNLKKEMNKRFTQVDKRFTQVDKRFDAVDERLDDLGTEVKHVKQDVGDLKYDTPTQKEFDKLEARMNKYYPLS